MKRNICRVTALIMLIVSALPFPLVKGWGDRLASDGTLERLTESVWLTGRLCLAGTALTLCALLLWRRYAPDGFFGFWRSVGRLPRRFCRDVRPFLADFRRQLPIPWLFWLIFAAGIAVRVLVLDRPLMHDEAYSIAIWGRSDLYFALSDYHLPNNHLFNTFWINLIYHHLGKQIWMLRLPVFLSGVLLIPTIWLIGRALYSERAGLTAAGLTAFAPFLIQYASNARGYEIQAFLTALSLLLAIYLLRYCNIFAWGLLILTSALNFWTLPIALYPFGGICVWFLLHVLFKRVAPSYGTAGRLFKYLIGCGLAVSALSMLLYLPLFKESGLESFFGNQYVGSVIEGEFIETSISRLQDTYHAFFDTLPAWVCILFMIGLFASLIFCRQIGHGLIPYAAGLFLAMAAIIAFQKPNLWPRTLLFLHPLLILWSSAGLCRLTENVRWMVFIPIAMVVGAGISQFREALPVFRTVGTDEKAVRVLMETEGENAANVFFATAAEDNAPIWCYADRDGLPRGIFDKNRAFNVVYALVNPLNDAYNGPTTLDGLLEYYGPGAAFVNVDSATVVMDEPDGILYRMDVYPSAIEKAFGASK